jgi:carboxylate-amine ligase
MTDNHDTEAQAGSTLPMEQVRFLPSAAGTIGVELELPVLDRESHELSPGAPRILAACEEQGVAGVSAELMQSMLEAKTGICNDVACVEDQLLTTLRRARHIGLALGYDLALLGTHPFQPVSLNAISQDERYDRVADRLGWLTYYRVTFGLHFHIGVESGDRAIGLINLLVGYLPHLVAASANSPFWQSVDTGWESGRIAMYGLIPGAGVPRYFTTWKEFRNYCRVMQDCKGLGSVRDIKWDIRPRPDLGTIEFRICDTPWSLERLLALAALTRSLVLFAGRLLDDRPRSGRGDRRRQWITVENRWLAARYGLDALYVRSPAGKRRLLRQDLEELVDRLLPIASESGDDRYLQRLRPCQALASGASRQREIFRQSGNWSDISRESTRVLARELGGESPAARTG